VHKRANCKLSSITVAQADQLSVKLHHTIGLCGNAELGPSHVRGDFDLTAEPGGNHAWEISNLSCRKKEKNGEL
jgi:hypothetical protein